MGRQRRGESRSALKGSTEQSKDVPVPKIEKPETKKWPTWENKVSRLQQKNLDELLKGWLDHVPNYHNAGEPPTGGVSEIDTVSQAFSRVQRDGDLIEPLEGIRPAVLHEAVYLAHKAVHVELSCIDLIEKGRHTWAAVDAYQSSLFAIASISAFLGISIDRDGNDFILIDIWSAPPAAKKKAKIHLGTEEYCQFLRFSDLGHYHKWAILQRLIRTLKTESPLIKLLSSAIQNINEREFALFRNKVHYNTSTWLFDDLLDSSQDVMITPALCPQDMLQAITDKTPVGTVYLMTLLNEVICMLLFNISSKPSGSIIKGDWDILERRRGRISSIVNYDMRQMYNPENCS